MIALLPALRSSMIGQDTFMYQYIFNEFVGKSWQSMWNFEGKSWLDFNSELGYFTLDYLISRFGDYTLFKAICSLMATLPACWIIYRYSNRPWLGYFIFYTLPIYTLLSMAAQRQGIAFGFCMIAFHFAMQRKLPKFLFFVFLAWTFHSSSVFFLFVWLIPYLGYKRRYNWVLLAAFLVVAAFSTAIFVYLNQFSRQEYDTGESGGIRMLIYFAALFFCSFFIPIKKLQEEDNKMYLYLLVYTSILWLIGLNLAALFRLAAYTEFFIALYISNTLFAMKPRAIRQIALTLIFFVSIALFNVLSIAERGQDYPVMHALIEK